MIFPVFRSGKIPLKFLCLHRDPEFRIIAKIQPPAASQTSHPSKKIVKIRRNFSIYAVDRQTDRDKQTDKLET